MLLLLPSRTGQRRACRRRSGANSWLGRSCNGGSAAAVATKEGEAVEEDICRTPRGLLRLRQRLASKGVRSALLLELLLVVSLWRGHDIARMLLVVSCKTACPAALGCGCSSASGLYACCSCSGPQTMRSRLAGLAAATAAAT